MQNFQKPRSARVGQMLTTLFNQCSSIILINIPSCCLWTGTIYPKRSACFPRKLLTISQLCLSATPPASTCTFPHSPLHRTISLLSKWWPSPQIFLFPNTHLGDLSACRRYSSLWSYMARELEGLSPCFRPASPSRRQHVTATPLHTQPTNPALSAASLYMLQ